MSGYPALAESHTVLAAQRLPEAALTPAPGFEPGIPEGTGWPELFPVLRTTRLCDAGLFMPLVRARWRLRGHARRPAERPGTAGPCGCDAGSLR